MMCVCVCVCVCVRVQILPSLTQDDQVKSALLFFCRESLVFFGVVVVVVVF